MKILLAEDTADLNRAVTSMLNMSGFAVDSAYDGEEAWELLQNNGYDGAVLDIMMPKMTGLEVLGAMREAGNSTPVLLLTAKSEVDDRVTGLDAGADDYLTKPFAMKELLARVKAITRRSTVYDGAQSKGDVVCGDLTLTAGTMELSSDSSIRLSAREFELLYLLASNEGVEQESAIILKRVWEGDETAGVDTVWLYINYLKTKLFSVGSSADITGEKGGSFKLVV